MDGKIITDYFLNNRDFEHMKNGGVVKLDISYFKGQKSLRIAYRGGTSGIDGWIHYGEMFYTLSMDLVKNGLRYSLNMGTLGSKKGTGYKPINLLKALPISMMLVGMSAFVYVCVKGLLLVKFVKERGG